MPSPVIHPAADSEIAAGALRLRAVRIRRLGRLWRTMTTAAKLSRFLMRGLIEVREMLILHTDSERLAYLANHQNDLGVK